VAQAQEVVEGVTDEDEVLSQVIGEYSYEEFKERNDQPSYL
jgi:hypothetical protein